MENHSFLLPQSKLIFKKVKSKKSFKNKTLGNRPNNFYSYLYLDQSINNKSLNEQKLFKTAFNTRKNSLLNSKNNSNSSSTKKSRIKNNRINKIYNSISLNKIKKVKNINNNNNLNIDQIEIKEQEDFNLAPILTKKFSNKFVVNYKTNQREEIVNPLKTENNQKLIFNNVGIHYHKVKNNSSINSCKNESKKDQEINKLKSQLLVLLKKNATLENEKKEKDNKIELLEEKLDKLLNFIKEKNLIGEDNEKMQLRKENVELKKELEKKNKIILTLTNKQIDNHSLNKKYLSIGKKKEKSGVKKYNISKKKSINGNNLDEADLKKIKLISIDPDNF